MTYDYSGAWDASVTKTDAHTRWSYINKTITDYTNAGVPASKLIVGMATYGRSFNTDQPNVGATFPGGCVAQEAHPYVCLIVMCA